jgi:hypothetical protein
VPAIWCSQTPRPGEVWCDDAFARVELADVDVRVRADPDRAVARLAREEQRERVRLRASPSVLLGIARRAAARSGRIQICSRCARSSRDGLNSLCSDAVAGAHVLEIARRDHAAVAHRVAVLEPAVEHVAEDLRVAVRVLAEAPCRARSSRR